MCFAAEIPQNDHVQVQALQHQRAARLLRGQSIGEDKHRAWRLAVSISSQDFAINFQNRCFGSRGISQAVDFIDANIDQSLELHLLAKVSAMSVFHFARRFKEAVGLSPHRYVMNRRVHRACQMLQCGRVRLADLALTCGFSSQAHFTTAFRREFGVTPGEYRRTAVPQTHGGQPSESGIRERNIHG